MNFIKYKNVFKFLLFFSIIFIFNGCDSTLLHNQGKIAQEEHSLIVISFIMMLIVVIPVIFMTVYFSFKYRCQNKNQIYKPNWSDSKKIEIIVWTIPILIISCLAYLTWHYSHKLEPSKSIPSLLKPIKIEVIALNWKWLFIYPEYHIATINEIAFPVHRPVIFHITSNSVMNSFFIPSLGSQIYAMPGMITQLNLISDIAGRYKGISSNYSGAGFSNMKFTAIAFANHDFFEKWIKRVQQSSQSLNTMKQFLTISMPNKDYSIQYFSHVNRDLFHQIIDQFYVKKISKTLRN